MRFVLLFCLVCLSVSISIIAQDDCGLDNHLTEGSTARVIPGPVNNAREAASTESDVLATLGGGKAFEVTGEAVCGEGYTWVPITFTTRDGFVDGWTAESDAKDYFVEPVEGTLIAGYGVTAILPEGIAKSVEITLHEKEPVTEEVDWTKPENIIITFTDYADDPQDFIFEPPSIAIYRNEVAETFDEYNLLQDLYEGMPITIEKMLTERPDLETFDPIYNRMPLFGLGAATVLLAHRDYLAFQNGDGYQTLASWGQDIYTPTNDSLEYDYVGLTDDGRFLISVVLPINADTLPPEENPYYDLESNEMKDYLKRIGDFFDELDDDSFTPDLSKIEALIASLYVGD